MIITHPDDYDDQQAEVVSLPPSYDELDIHGPEAFVPMQSLRAAASSPALHTMNERRRPVPPTPDLRITAPRIQTEPTSSGLLSVPGSSSGTSRHRTSSESQSSPYPRHFNAVIYTFAQESSNTMTLSADLQESPVRYHISVQMNCFIPSSYITVLRRDSENGEVIGSFEMGISTKRSTVTMEGSEKLTNSVLQIRQKCKTKDLWDWKFDQNPRLHLSWHCESPVKYCFMTQAEGSKEKEATLLASFTPLPSLPRADFQPSPPATLKIFPEGQRYADNIVFSALILERRRLTPNAEKQLRGLFT